MTNLQQTLDAASQAGARGEYATACLLLEEFLDTRPSADEESLARSRLAAIRSKMGELARAADEVRRAVKLASSPVARARALLASATIRLETWTPDVPQSDFEETLKDLTEAVGLFEELGTVDFLAALLTLAGAWQIIPEIEVAGSLYRRVVAEVRTPRWATVPLEQRNGLEARAYYGLAACAVLAERPRDAKPLLDSAADVVPASDPGTAAMIADAYEDVLGDTTAAKRIRKRLRR